MPSRLAALGWNDFFATAFAGLPDGLVPARVIQQRGLYGVGAEEGDFLAVPSGRFRHESLGPMDYPAVGDWVALRLPEGEGQALIHSLLPRRSCFSRKGAGRRPEEQVVAANVDTVFLVSGLDNDYNPRRIERYLAAAWDSGAQPVILLNKADRCADPQACRDEIEALALGVSVHVLDALHGEGVGELREHLAPGRTVALLGSSGVGKSTILNRLLGGDVQRTREVREGDDRGQHTTTHRELFLSPEGWLVIDTPGMRELQLWDSDEGLQSVFSDVEDLAAQCPFSDCRHETEPGCAVLAALEDGTLPAERLESFRKLQKERAHLRTQTDVLAKIREKQKWKKIHKAMRGFKK